MLKFMQNLAGNLNAKYGGMDTKDQQQFLEAVAAGIALISAADGEVEKAERNKAQKLLAKNSVTGSVFSESQRKKALDHAFELVESGRSGKVALEREIREVLDYHADWAEDIMVVVLDVAESDGEIEKAEVKVLNKISEVLSVDWKQFADEVPE